MTEKEFLNRVANGESDILELLLDILEKQEIDYCVIGGLAVNAYVEPVVSLDLDIVITTDKINKLKKTASDFFSIKEIPHSSNLTSKESNLRIQIQTDKRYQNFISTSTLKSILGYEMQVASLEHVLQGKVWAYSDKERRKSKRQKDLADIFRLVEAYPHLESHLPDELRGQLGDA